MSVVFLFTVVAAALIFADNDAEPTVRFTEAVAVFPAASVTLTVSVFVPVAVPATQSYLFDTISFAITTVLPFAVMLYVYLYFRCYCCLVCC